MTEADALERFKQFCLAEMSANEDDKFDPCEERDWFSLSLGFFAALGLNSRSANKLAGEARYTHHYWAKRQKRSFR